MGSHWYHYPGDFFCPIRYTPDIIAKRWDFLTVERATSCIVAWAVSSHRIEPLLQGLVDQPLQARFYYSDLVAPYRKLLYSPGIHTLCLTKVNPTASKGIIPKFATTWLAWLAQGNAND